MCFSILILDTKNKSIIKRIYTAPKNIIEYIEMDNKLYGYDDVPTQLDTIDLDFKKDLISAIEKLPNQIKKKNFRKNAKELLSKRKVLFEAGILTGDLFSRADILKPVGKDAWDIIEVKGGTSVKDINVHDVSFQKYCYEQAGLTIRNCYLMHLNNKYIKQGDIDLKELFEIEDITEQVDEEEVVVEEEEEAEEETEEEEGEEDIPAAY